MTTSIRALLAAIVAVAGSATAIMLAAPAHAAVCTATWAGPANGNWNTVANWSPAQVPTATSQVCIDTAGGPFVRANTHAAADNLELSGTAIKIDGTLTATAVQLTASTVTGSGTLATTDPNGADQLSGVQAGGGVRLNLAGGAFVSGRRTMCGKQLSLCLNGTSTLTASGVNVSGNVGGNTTALSSVGGVFVSGPAAAYRINVPVSATSVQDTVAGSTLRLDQWQQLAADGTLSATLDVEGATLVLARSIVTMPSGSTILQRGDVQTTAGADALGTLTSITGGSNPSVLALPSVVQPVGGLLTVAPTDGPESTQFVATPSPVTIEGTLENDGFLTLDADVVADAYTGAGHATYLDGSLQVTTAAFHAGYLAAFTGSDLTAPDGITFDGTSVLQGYTKPTASCGVYHGDVAMTGDSSIHAYLGVKSPSCPLFSTSGSFTLPSTLVLTGSQNTGITVVLVDAAGGVNGRFTTITGAPASATITYTATKVTLTY